MAVCISFVPAIHAVFLAVFIYMVNKEWINPHPFEWVWLSYFATPLWALAALLAIRCFANASLPKKLKVWGIVLNAASMVIYVPLAILVIIMLRHFRILAT